MTQLEKAIARLRERSGEARIDDVRRVLAALGYQEVRQHGSHITFVHPRRRRFTVPVSHGKAVKRVYVVQVLEEVDLDE